MSKEKHRGGKAYTRRHSAVTETGKKVCEILERCPHQIKIFTGPINPRKGANRGGRRIKITTDEKIGRLELSVIGDGAQQNMRVRVSNVEEARNWILARIEDHGIQLME